MLLPQQRQGGAGAVQHRRALQLFRQGLGFGAVLDDDAGVHVQPLEGLEHLPDDARRAVHHHVAQVVGTRAQLLLERAQGLRLANDEDIVILREHVVAARDDDLVVPVDGR